jgi:uncharacterized small protein (DUF1192 family)
MASAKKKANKGDPISDRARALNEQIASLESEIKRLDGQLQRTTAPKLRSTAIPHGGTVSRKVETPKPVTHEPVFEEIKPLPTRAETESPDHFNQLGVRKYDLPGLWTRLRDAFRRPTTSNPRLVNYLAAGGVHGLRPMRYEKRVARNRFVVLVGFLFLLLLGLIYVFTRIR